MTKYLIGASVIGLLALAGSSVVQAQQVTHPTPTSRGIALSTTAAQVMAANPTRIMVSIQNTDAAISECYSFTTITPVCGAVDTFTIPAGALYFWPVGSAPNSALYMIAASGTPKVSVTEGN